MHSDSGATQSIWMDTTDVPQFSKLDVDTRANVCIIGAGIAGLSAAYMLTRAGKVVVVIDDGPIGGGETGRTTAHLSNALDDRYTEIAKLFGDEGARHAAESHTAAIQRIEAIVSLEEIDCDFERLDGFLFLAKGGKPEELEDELAASHAAGLTDTGIFQRAPIDAFDTGMTLRFPRQAQFHPLKYLAGLARAIVRDGGRIYTGTRAKNIQDGEPARVETSDGHTILAEDVIVATNSPVNDWMVIHTKQAAYRTYVIGVRVPDGALPHFLSGTRRIHITTCESRAPTPATCSSSAVRITRPASRRRTRILSLSGGMDTRAVPDRGRGHLRWSGQVMEPVDAMAFIGKNPGGDENIYIATGDSGNGMTHGTIAGILLTDLILGARTWETLYDPVASPCEPPRST